jgi:predicted nucleotidyltransferase
VTEEIAARTRLSYAGALRLLASKLACIELVPYHSAGLKLDARLRALPSARNARALVRTLAESRDLTWIVTRQLDAWSEALSTARGRVLTDANRRRSVSFSLDGIWGQAILECVGLSKKAPENVSRMLQPGLDRLVRALQPEAIYLFGSRARGDARPDSDFDLMVVLPDDAAKERVSVVKARSALGDVGHPVDVLVTRRRQFDEHLHLRASLPAVIADEGRVLYAG